MKHSVGGIGGTCPEFSPEILQAENSAVIRCAYSGQCGKRAAGIRSRFRIDLLDC